MIELDVGAWPAVVDGLRRGVPVTIVVDGEPCPECGFPDEDCYACDYCHNTCRVPPAEFRALPETCETCKGTGRVAWTSKGEAFTAPCDECVGGVPLVEFVAFCPNPQCFYAFWQPCGQCDNGRVRLGRGTVRLTPDGDKFAAVLTPQGDADG